MKNENAVKWLWRTAGRKKWLVILQTAIQSLLSFSGVLYALLLRNIVDRAADHDRNGFIVNALLTVTLITAQIAVRAAYRRFDMLTRASVENLYKGRLFGCLLRKDYQAVSAVHSAEWINRLTNDTTIIADGFAEILPGMIGMLVKLVSAAVMLTVLDRRFACLAVPLGLVMTVFTYVFSKKLKRMHKDIQERDGALRIFYQERLASMMMIRSFTAEKQAERESAEKMKAHLDSRMKRNRIATFAHACFGFSMHGMYVFGVCWCGYGILTGRITFGTLTAITQLIAQIQMPFANLSGYLPKYYAMTASAERLIEAEMFDDDMTGTPMTLEEAKDFYDSKLESIGLDNVDFTYYAAVSEADGLTKDSSPAAVRGLSLEIRKGEYAAFTGHSGCGKSTALKLLMCVYRPDSGERYVTDREGRRIIIDPRWHRLFAYVPQGNMLMSGTVRDIVSFSDKNCPEEKIRQAIRIACADEFIGELEQGLDTMLGERGSGLSEGQMQRLAIARAVCSKSPVLLLDEATSALDEQTERRVLENLRSMTDRTVLIITHRPAALEICDRVIPFE